jgi:hypothetical protein
MLRRLRQIARSRSAGASWPLVATQVGLAVEACERLVEEYAEEYRPMFRQELRWRLLDSLAEAMAVLRVGLRREEFREQRDSALGLLKLQQAVAGRRSPSKQVSQLDRETLAVATYLAQLSEAEEQALVEQALENRQAAAQESEPGA